jgi:hypothetical protein
MDQVIAWLKWVWTALKVVKVAKTLMALLSRPRTKSYERKSYDWKIGRHIRLKGEITKHFDQK